MYMRDIWIGCYERFHRIDMRAKFHRMYIRDIDRLVSELWKVPWDIMI